MQTLLEIVMAPEGSGLLATCLNYSARPIQPGLTPPRRPRSSPRWLALRSEALVEDPSAMKERDGGVQPPKTCSTFIYYN